MVSNSLSRRRHVITSPAICIKPPWPPPPYPPTIICPCTIFSDPMPGAVTFSLMYNFANPSAPAGSPILIWVHSQPELDWGNPYVKANNSAGELDTKTFPPGTPPITVTAGLRFNTGQQCSAHCIVVYLGS